MQEIIFTPAALLDILSQVDELKDVDIGITETINNQIQLQIGESIYILKDANATEILVDDTVIDAIGDANLYAYENLSDLGRVDMDSVEPIKSGILKELAKTLLVGGMVRLSAKLLK